MITFFTFSPAPWWHSLQSAAVAGGGRLAARRAGCPTDSTRVTDACAAPFDDVLRPKIRRTKSWARARELPAHGENFACAATAVHAPRGLKPVRPNSRPPTSSRRPGPKAAQLVVAIGHVGNFELYARFGSIAPPTKAHHVPGLRQPSLNTPHAGFARALGCLYFERRTDGAALRPPESPL